MTKSLAVASMALAALLACPSSIAASAAAQPSLTGFVHSCETQMYMSHAECSCLADKAVAELDDTGIAYLSLNALDYRRASEMSKAMSGSELRKIDKFMSTAPAQCRASS
jgi:hypothetical protein